MGRPGMVEKQQNLTTQLSGRSRIRRPDPTASGDGWPRIFADKVASPCSSSLAGACSKVAARNNPHGQNPFGLKTGRNDLVRGP